MKIPVVIHKDDGSVYGVTVPDISGCHSWGETIDDAMNNTKEAIRSHVETLLLLNEPVDVGASKIENLVCNADYANGILALVDVDLRK